MSNPRRGPRNALCDNAFVIGVYATAQRDTAAICSYVNFVCVYLGIAYQGGLDFRFEIRRCYLWLDRDLIENSSYTA